MGRRTIFLDVPAGSRGLRPLHVGEGWFADRPGGLNRYLRDLLAVQRRAGDAPVGVVVGPADEVPEGVHVASNPDRPIPRRLAELFTTIRALETEVDVVDIHFAVYGWAALASSHLRGLPRVVHFQGPWGDESKASGEASWKATTKRWIERPVYRNADRLVVLSPSFKRLLVERYRVQPWDVEVIPPGVDLARFTDRSTRAARTDLDLPADRFVAVAVRRLVPRMGLDVLLDAWAGADLPDGLLLIVGEGSQGEQLEQQARALNLEGSVRFLGRLSDDDLVSAYQSADVSVVPSRSLEGFGLVVLESLACGTPPIVTDVDGLNGTTHDLQADLVVPPDSSQKIGARLEGAYDGTRPLPSPQECRAFAETFSWEQVAGHHRSVYRRAAAGSLAVSRPQVVYVDHCARLSGAELSLLRLLPALCEDVEVHVVLGEDGPLVSRLERAGISVEVLPMGEAGRDLRKDRVTPGRLPLRSLASAGTYTARLAWRLHQLDPDLVHTNSLKAALYGSVAARLCGVPAVWHAHDRIDADYLPRAAAGLVRAVAARLPAATIANSRATLRTLGETGSAASVVPYAVDPDLFCGSCAIGDDVRRVGIVGRLAPWKGQHVFLEAFARAFPEDDVEAVIVGGPLFGEERYASGLRGLAERRGIADRVEFRGHREDIAAELRGLDILVHASVVPEPFGQVIIEGMAAGVPVIAAAAGGPLDIVDDGRTGVLAPASDPGVLADRLAELASDRRLRQRLAESARKEAERYRPDRIASAVADVYDRVLRATTAGRPADR